MSYAVKALLTMVMVGVLTGCATSKGPGSGQDAGAAAPSAGTDTGAEAYGYDQGAAIDGESALAPGADAPRARVVYFDFDSTQIRADSRPVVEAHAAYLASRPGSVVILEGHTDERGSREYNIGLGERRGDSVRRLMIAFGVPVSQIRVVSYGEERPDVTGQSEADFAANRRVVISY
jgi:peptidoglycan-associated lipoprotein